MADAPSLIAPADTSPGLEAPSAIGSAGKAPGLEAPSAIGSAGKEHALFRIRTKVHLKRQYNIRLLRLMYICPHPDSAKPAYALPKGDRVRLDACNVDVQGVRTLWHHNR
jgi:hypothetical protein